MSNLLQQDPQGRVDVLVYRLIERVASAHAPAEWPFLQPLAESIAKQFSPKRRRRRLTK